MIDVFGLMAEGKIEDGAILKVFEDSGYPVEFLYQNAYRTFLDEEYDELYEYFDINSNFLNLEVYLEQPSKQKYRIKLPDSKFCLAYVKNGGEEEFLPVVPCSLYVDQIIGLKDGEYVFKTEFTKQDFAEIEKLKAYEQFKELIKDDEK